MVSDVGVCCSETAVGGWGPGGALTGHGRGQLPGGAVWHVNDGGGRFVHHHLVLVPQAALDEVKQGAVVSGG